MPRGSTPPRASRRPGPRHRGRRRACVCSRIRPAKSRGRARGAAPAPRTAHLRREGGDPRPHRRVVLPPVAAWRRPRHISLIRRSGIPALNCDSWWTDGHLPGSNASARPGPPKAARESVRLLGVDEEVLIEEADLVERRTPDEERGRHRPVDIACLAPSRLDNARSTQREQAERRGRRRGEAPRRKPAAARRDMTRRRARGRRRGGSLRGARPGARSPSPRSSCPR